MIQIDEELAKYGLDRQAYENCLQDISNKLNGLNDMDWSEIVDKYKLGIHYDTLRKASTTIFGGAFVSEYIKETESTVNATNGYLAALQMEKHEIQKEKQKLSDEKREYNRWLRTEARDELILQKIAEEVARLPELPLPQPLDTMFARDKAGILCFADTHYGTEFCIKGLHGETINEYSPEIFEERMEELLYQTISKARRDELTDIYVFSLGDEIDGILRASQLMKLRYGVVESTVRYADYICRWLARLTQDFRVHFCMAYGNHTELRMIGQPKGTFEDDNMSKVIKEFISVRMEGNPNFEMITNPSGLIYDNIMGFNVLGIHGEVKNLATAIQSFSNTYNTQIDVLVGGHMHHYRAETVGVNRDIISVPSIIGVDGYALQLGKTSNPGATFIIIEEGKGVVEQSIFKFDM